MTRMSRLLPEKSQHEESAALRVVLFTDTLGDVNGVSRFIKDMSASAYAEGRELHVITSTPFPVPDRPNIHNVRPFFSRPMPGYGMLHIVIPRVLRMLKTVRRLRPDAIHISTPGPVGLVGLLAARLLGVPRLGVYHTDFPAYVEKILQSRFLTGLAKVYMRAFYRSFHTIFSRSADYLERMRQLGLRCARSVRIVPGIALHRFDPSHARKDLWERFDGVRPDSLKMLYVGRVSVEKNLDTLARIWPAVRDACARAGRTVELIVVGDGPFRAPMQKACGEGAHFLGFRHKEELSQLYASSDLFVFPSLTDTLGQAVLESLASGLAAVVSDVGGPQEFVDEGISGRVVDGRDDRAWIDALVELATDDAQRQRLGRSASVRMQRYPVGSCFERFWRDHARAVVETKHERSASRSAKKALKAALRALKAPLTRPKPKALPEPSASAPTDSGRTGAGDLIEGVVDAA